MKIGMLFDLHAHIIPGIDDGASSWDEAYAMLEIAAADGISIIAATPHFIEGWFEPSPEEVLEGTTRLNQYAREKGLPIQVIPGMEVGVSLDIPRWLEEGKLLTFNQEGKYLLVELPSQEIPLYLEELLFQLQLSGVTPVIAHPERNRGIAENPQRLQAVVERGALAQITGDSLLGRFGKAARKTALELLQAGIVHGLGSDAHSDIHRKPKLTAAVQNVIDLVGETRGLAIAGGEDIEIKGIKDISLECESLLKSDSIPKLVRDRTESVEDWAGNRTGEINKKVQKKRNAREEAVSGNWYGKLRHMGQRLINQMIGGLL